MNRLRLLVVFLGALLMHAAALASSGGGDRINGLPFATRSPVIAPKGAAATAHPLATQIAIDILKAGGSAVDAAIAANAALGLMEPVGCGAGGDLFAIVWDPKTRRLYGLNASGRSPKGRTLEQLRAKLGGRTAIPKAGSLSVTVPGAVDGWFELHGRFGKLPMDKVLAPAIGYARDGFPLTQLIAYYWERNMAALAKSADVEEFDNAKATYLVGGLAPREGQMFRNPDLARTYEILARDGRDAFYKGELARTMDAYFKRIGGDLRLEDFAAHKSEWIDPAHVSYRGYDVYGLPPNSQGLATLQILKIMEGFDVKAWGPGSPDYLHAFIEAKRLVFADAAKYYADPAFARIPVDWLLSDSYAKERRSLIRMDRAADDVAPGEEKLRDGDTTYLTVADSDGMMVSLIQSNFRGMGSGLVPDGLGFMFQDRGELFSLEDGHANLYAPGKRPFQTIIPGFVMKDGEPWLAYGVMGGDMQPQGHAQVLINLIDFGMNLQEAGDAARIRHGQERDAGPDAPPYGELELESGIGPETRAELVKRGHVISDGRGGFGGYQAIMRDPETAIYWAASESRKDGAAMGY